MPVEDGITIDYLAYNLALATIGPEFVATYSKELKEFFPNVELSILMREWSAFLVFIMLESISSVYKDSKKGLELFDKYLVCASGMLGEEIFSDTEKTFNFIRNRITSYVACPSEYKNLNPMYAITKKFHEYLGDINLSGMVYIGNVHLELMKSNISFLKDVSHMIEE